MALVSDGTGRQADKIASGSIGERPAGVAGMIRHCTTRREITDEPGSILEYYDPTSNKWQQLASFFAVEGVELFEEDDVRPGYGTSNIEKDPNISKLGSVTVPYGYDNFFVVASMGFQMNSSTYDEAWGENSAQMSLMLNGWGRSNLVGYLSTQASYKCDVYGYKQKFNTSCSASTVNPNGRDKAVFNLGANQQKTGSNYCDYLPFDTNLAVLAWRSVR